MRDGESESSRRLAEELEQLWLEAQGQPRARLSPEFEAELKADRDAFADEYKKAHALVGLKKRVSLCGQPNRIEALEYIALFHRCGGSPPESALAALAEAYEEWSSLEGRVSLDAVFGVLAEGRGRTPPVKRKLLDERDHRMYRYMGALVALGASYEDAAAMVAERDWSNESWFNSAWGVAPLSAATLQRGFEGLPADEKSLYVELLSVSVIRLDRGIPSFLAQFPPPMRCAPNFLPAERKRAFRVVD